MVVRVLATRVGCAYLQIEKTMYNWKNKKLKMAMYRLKSKKLKELKKLCTD